MRYVSWFGGWLGTFRSERMAEQRTTGRNAAVLPPRSAELSSEDLFYIAMLGPHV
ncbi:hypothetical protein [Bradyrhizobium sp. SZCCHNS3052]|uniref:hypothetical protein n=1 Tax=unclassified Bradyrhizobium TaxID=2631580 RepID=UPI0029162A00|nr:hypothetical protein [Bradyrhizobium sp. SZCCHNS3052]